MSIALLNALASATETSANPIKEILASGKATDQVAHPEYWSSVFSIVAIGIVVVFSILVILVFTLWLLGKIISFFTGKKKNDENKEERALPTPPTNFSAALAVADEVKEDDEILAAISAAIAAFSAEEGKNYRITGIKRTERKSRGTRSAWSMAGISENMRRL